MPQANLNSKVDDNSNMTVGEYLKPKTTNELKISAVINELAEENNIYTTSKKE